MNLTKMCLEWIEKSEEADRLDVKMDEVDKETYEILTQEYKRLCTEADRLKYKIADIIKDKIFKLPDGRCVCYTLESSLHIKEEFKEGA